LSFAGLALPLIRFYREVLNVKYIGVLYPNDDRGINIARSLTTAAQKYAPDMVLRLVDAPRRTASKEDLYDAMQMLKDTEFRYFISSAYNFEHTMEAANDFGIAVTGDHNWMVVGDLVATPDDPTTGIYYYPKNSTMNKALQGVSHWTPMLFEESNDRYKRLVDTILSVKENPEDLQYLQSKLPSYPTRPDLFDLTNPIYLDPTLDAGQLVEAVAYDTIISAGLAACNISRGGDKYFNGPDHYKASVTNEFMGTSGYVVLDKDTGTRDPNSLSFVLKTFKLVEESTRTSEDGITETGYAQVSTYKYDGENFEQMSPLIFNDGRTDIPSDLPNFTLDENYIGMTLRVLGLILSATVMILSIVFGIWTFLHRKNRVVLASQPIFLYIICVGTFLMGASILFLSIDDEIATDKVCDGACMTVPWFLSVGFVTAFGSLFAKTWRINRIFHCGNMRRVKITEKDVMLPLLAFVAVDVLLLSLWMGFSPLYWDRSPSSRDEWNRVISSHGQCAGDNWLGYVIPLAVVDMGVLAAALYQAIEARDISLEFSETEYIFKALASAALVSVVGIPVMVIVTDNPSAYFFVLTCIIFALAFSLLMFIFLPKIQYFRQSKDKQSRTIKDAIHESSQKKKEISGTSLSLADNIEANTLGTAPRTASDPSASSPDQLRVLDTPEMRKETNKENTQLKNEVANLVAEIRSLKKELESIQNKSKPSSQQTLADDIECSAKQERRVGFIEEFIEDGTDSVLSGGKDE